VQLCCTLNIHSAVVLYSQYSKYCCYLRQGDEESSNIALRTRSKLPLNDTPLDVIESSFVAPDITADLYDETSSLVCDDDDWKSFLSGLYKQG